MQVWIHYIPGVGGDGFANLLEQAQEVVLFDSETKLWRFHRICQGQLKFYGPALSAESRAFRESAARISSLNKQYVHAVKSGKTVVYPCHDVLHQSLDCCAEKDILTFERVNLLLINPDIRKCVIDAHVKNQRPVPAGVSFDNLVQSMTDLQHQAIKSGLHDIIIDINDLRYSSDMFSGLCNSLKLTISEDQYRFYRVVSASTSADLVLKSLNFLERSNFEEAGDCYGINAIDSTRVNDVIVKDVCERQLRQLYPNCQGRNLPTDLCTHYPGVLVAPDEQASGGRRDCGLP